MKQPVDLHIHSTFSDGTYTVDEICKLAVKKGIRTIALSDHDTTNGLEPMRKAAAVYADDSKSLSFLPAIELSSGENGLIHVLGYGVKHGVMPLSQELDILGQKRVDRTRGMLELLIEQGVNIPREAVERVKPSNQTTGRVHVARILISHQIINTVDEAFEKYIGVGKPAYIPLDHMSTEDAISVLLQSNAVPVLAHPMRGKKDKKEMEAWISLLKEQGLAGLEVFHPSASHSDVKWLYQLAQKLELLVTGGSDFHGQWGRRSKLGGYPSGWQSWEQDLALLYKAVEASDEFSQ